MKRIRLKPGYIFILFGFLSTFCDSGLAQISPGQNHINIAVVRDGLTPDLGITERIKPELLHLLGEDYSFNFVESSDFNAQWDPNKFRSVVENALND